MYPGDDARHVLVYDAAIPQVVDDVERATGVRLDADELRSLLSPGRPLLDLVEHVRAAARRDPLDDREARVR